MFQRGIITGLSGNPMSGLWMLLIDGAPVPISSGTGVRALANAFGATEGTGDILDKIVGEEIIYSTDFVGVMEGFTPAADWSGPEVPYEGLDEDEYRRWLQSEEAEGIGPEGE